MTESKRIFLLILIMIGVSLVVAGIAIYVLYQAAMNEGRGRLMESAQSQARLIEAIARFDAVQSRDFPEGSKAATISQIVDAHKHYKGFGQTGEFTLAQREGDQIVFLLSHRHYDLENPKPVPWDAELAEPMRRALSGKSGTVIAFDYRGELVLAAHEPVAELDLGIVAKIDLAEVRRPFVRAGLVGFGSAVVVVVLGSLLFVGVSNPMVRRLEELYRTTQKELAERKRITQELSRTLEQQNGLNRILRAIQMTQTPVQVLEVAVDHVLQISWLGMQARAAAFLLRGQQLHKVVSRNLAPAVDQGCARIALGQCLCGRVAQTGEPILSASCNDDEWHHHIKGMGDHGHVILPLKWQSQILGVLCFYVSAGDELDNHRRDFLEAVASVVATAIGRLTYQSQLVQSERLANLGLVAAGVAHEIKNPLGLALTSVEWLVEDLPSLLEHSRILRQRVIDEFGAERASLLLSDLADLRNDELLQEMAQCPESALDGVRRVSTIVRDLGAFSRVDEDQLTRVSLVDVLERALTLAYNEIKYRARLIRDFKQTLHVLANEGRLSQVFLNLLINAAQAIDKGHPEDNEIRVRLWHEGKEVFVEVKDTGRGIDPADRPYVFEPFFTTKEQGVGTGLGLYISNNIVTSLGGHIDVESTVGRGTRFVVRFPIAEPLAPGSTTTPSDKEENLVVLQESGY